MLIKSDIVSIPTKQREIHQLSSQETVIDLNDKLSNCNGKYVNTVPQSTLSNNTNVQNVNNCYVMCFS